MVLCGRSAGEPDLLAACYEAFLSRRNLSLTDFTLMEHLVAGSGDISRRMDGLMGS